LDDSLFSDAFCRFLKKCVPTVFSAELLLELAKHPDRWWELGDLLASVPPANVARQDARKYLETQAQLVKLDADERVRYLPTTEEIHSHVQTLARAYNERPVTLIRVIYAFRDSRIRSFADAFRIRKD
jgi:hypothetical protein